MENTSYLEAFMLSRKLTKYDERIFFLYEIKFETTKSDCVIEEIARRIVRRLSKRLASYDKNYCLVTDFKYIYSEVELPKEFLTFIPVSPTEAGYSLFFRGSSQISLEHKNIYQNFFKKKIKALMLNTENSRFSKIDNKLAFPNAVNFDSNQRINHEKQFIPIEYKDLKIYFPFDFSIYIDETYRLFAMISSSSKIHTSSTIQDYILNNENIEGLNVKYTLPFSTYQSGYIVDTRPAENEFNTAEKIADNFAKRYKDYSFTEKIVKEIKALPPGRNNVVTMHCRQFNRNFSYLAQYLVPFIDFEQVSAKYPNFAKKITQYMRREMRQRLIYDVLFIKDLNALNFFKNAQFSLHPVPAYEFGYSEKVFDFPTLICGRNHEIKETKKKTDALLSTYGYYIKPAFQNINLALVGNKSQYDTSKMDNMISFLYKYCGLAQLGKGIIKPTHHLLDISKLTNTALKEKINEIQESVKADFIFTALNNIGDNSQFYSCIKKQSGTLEIPTQNIQLSNGNKLIEEFNRAKGNDNVDFLIKRMGQNIAMGILSGLGGIPYIIKNPAINFDIILGIDIASIRNSVHIPCCAVSYTGTGIPICAYQPLAIQSGETTSNETLQDIFDTTIIEYKRITNREPKSFLLLRDGFFREDLEFCKNYFNQLNITFSVFEVRKSGAFRIATHKENTFINPTPGTILFKGETEANIVTSEALKYGAPRPIHVKRIYGNCLDFKKTCELIFQLTKIYPGAVQDVRLPAPLYIADKICKAIDNIPRGKLLHFIPCL